MFLYCLGLLLLYFLAFTQSSTAALCNDLLYGRPLYPSCITTFQSFPLPDMTQQFFAEQQLRARIEESDWPLIVDPRPAMEKKGIVQLPKLWSFGMYDDDDASTCFGSPALLYITVSGQLAFSGVCISFCLLSQRYQ